MDHNDITGKIIGAACKVHSALGPGLLEEPYKRCLKHQLKKDGLRMAKRGALVKQGLEEGS